MRLQKALATGWSSESSKQVLLCDIWSNLTGVLRSSARIGSLRPAAAVEDI
jgi:hypothetical protein